ncbi:helix-turn-helix domain-containing protein [Halovenus sp. WSH3]|uniref:Helix-turn-helix domain-containing protein n=1 Tax=Halovenus carboxidivorans TaxID=2692199 RepID=A0A6B0T5E5_9EURY|nr:helix-turn-helix domain-containing protein [Halovenus carboxidivorans]MXR51406.1 helix-turn-helix domain-containing protein [Halovenus carboxidivorans]
MSSRQGGRFRRSPQRQTEQTIDDETEISTLMGALEDSDCRAILEAASDRALSASELCEICDLPSSTAYRKVDQLTEAGLLEESVRLCTNGSHTSEYSLAVADLEIDLQGGVELTMTEGAAPPAAAD